MLRVRDRQPELMDDPELDRTEHSKALQGLQRVNLVSATAGRLWHEMSAYADSAQGLRVLDVGCGGGDILVDLGRRAIQAGVPFHGVGCDLSQTACEHARHAAGSLVLPSDRYRLEFLQHDCLRDELPQGFDVVICTLLLHHLEWDEAIQLLSKMRTSARKAVLVDDLLRSIAGYTLAWVGTRALTRSRIVHVDGPRSVRAAFRLTELHELADAAGLTPARFVPHWPFRCLLHWSRVR